MSSDMIKISSKPTTRQRAPQGRAEETRTALLDIATAEFATHTYDGISVRALETAAGVQRGAAAYHFGDKAGLWKAAVDRILRSLEARIEPLSSMLQDLDEEARVRAVIAAFVRFSADTPELNRLIIQEGRTDSWRLHYLIESFHRNRFAWLRDMVGVLQDPHTYYMTIGAATLVFNAEHECRELFGIDPTSDEFIREHAARVADLIIFLRQQEKGKTP